MAQTSYLKKKKKTIFKIKQIKVKLWKIRKHMEDVLIKPFTNLFEINK